MAIQNARILIRRGNEVDFDANNMQPGEWALSTDEKIVRICVAPGVCIRMATYDAFEADMAKIEAILAECRDIQTVVNRINDEVSANAKAVAEYTEQAKQYRDEAEQFRNEAESIVCVNVSQINSDIALNRHTLGYTKKNLLKNIATTQTFNGGTITVNADKSVTINGTFSKLSTLNIDYKNSYETAVFDVRNFIGKEFIASISPNSINGITLQCGYFKEYGSGINTSQESVSTSVQYSYPEDAVKSRTYLRVSAGTYNNVTVYPMIRLASITDPTYEPYVDDVDTRLDKIDNSILNTLEEIEANTNSNMIAGALALKEINGNINRDFYGTSGYSQAFDLIPNNDVTAPLSRLGSCYISNEEEVTTYHAPETGYAFAFGKNVTRYAIIFIGASKVWYRRYPIGWKEL